MQDNLLSLGTKAPEFTLKDTPDQSVSLSQLQGKPVILVFYPADFSPVCGSEIDIFNVSLPEFKKYNTQVLGISVDNIWSHLAFAQQHHVRFPLLADFHPKGQVSITYHAYDEKTGESKRALYLIDVHGNISWNYLSPVGVNPGANGVLDALKKL